MSTEGFESAATQTDGTAATTTAEDKTTSTATGSEVTTLDDGRIVVGGKVFTAEAAAKKIENADQHITTIEQENAKKDELNIKLLERIEALEKVRNVEQTQEQVHQQAAAEQSSTQEISMDDLVNGAADVLEKRRIEEQQKVNLAASVESAKQAYGEDFGPKVDEKAQAYNMDTEAVLTMARNNPNAFKALFIPEGSAAAAASADTTGSTVQGDTGQAAPAAPKAKSWTKMRTSKERQAYIDAKMAAIQARDN